MLHQTPSFFPDSVDQSAPPRKPRTLIVLLMLVLAAGTFSYLWAYAVPDALIAAEVLSRWPEGKDPRPQRLGVAFAGLMGTFLIFGVAARFLSGRQMRRIDAMGDE